MDFMKVLAPKSMQEKETNMCLWICSTILSLWSLFGITWQSLVMQSSDPRGRIVYSIHKLMIDSYIPVPQNVLTDLKGPKEKYINCTMDDRELCTTAIF